MRRPALLFVVGLLVVVACGESPLQSFGERSASWINEPEIVTTTVPVITAPRFVRSDTLLWSNDEIVNNDLGDRDAVIAAVFARRQGDSFIQASRLEIVTALPDVSFPAVVPYGAEWVSSQLVIENNGRLSAEPSAAFGIWSAEPYTKSRSVAQMAVLRVSDDPETAVEVTEPDADLSCARFAERTTDECSIVGLGDQQFWKLSSPSGNTLVWFDAPYRYELFGRPFVPVDVLEAMASERTALSLLTSP